MISVMTLLVIFQNRELQRNIAQPTSFEMSVRPATKGIDRKRTLVSTLPCQDLIESGLVKKTIKIPDSFMPITFLELCDVMKEYIVLLRKYNCCVLMNFATFLLQWDHFIGARSALQQLENSWNLLASLMHWLNLVHSEKE